MALLKNSGFVSIGTLNKSLPILGFERTGSLPRSKMGVYKILSILSDEFFKCKLIVLFKL